MNIRNICHFMVLFCEILIKFSVMINLGLRKGVVWEVIYQIKIEWVVARVVFRYEFDFVDITRKTVIEVPNEKGENILYLN